MDTYQISTNQCVESITHLLAKYRNDPYMFAKIHNYVCFQLPTMMSNIQKSHIERQQRIAELTVEQDGFIERFLNTHRYFYVPTTETFVFYDGQRYTITTEDSILYHILTTITREKQLMIWKQRTKVFLMKRIKDNLLSKTIPETETIQHVLSTLHPALFSTKHETKYFLTILGDNLLRKRETDLVHFITPKAKAFLREITQISQLMFGVNGANTFKHKYYDHEYAQCRLVSVNDCVASEHVWGPILTEVSIDMLCVACHYSMRYGSSDDYVSKFSNQDTLETSVFYLRNHSRAQLVERFVNEYLEVSPVSAQPSSTTVSPSTTPPTSAGYLTASVFGDIPNARPSRQISWKNMQYLWRHFLDSQRLPAVMFQQDLKSGLVETLAGHYREDTDTFVGVSSRFMPAIREFLAFWESTMVYEETGEYEIDEICLLYKKWLVLRQRDHPAPIPTGALSLNEKQMTDLIAYYFTYVEFEKDKYLFGVRCSLWDKQMDIQTALEQMKETLRESTNTDIDSPDNRTYATTLYDAYLWYCRYYSSSSGKPVDKHPIVNKAYFDKYVSDNIGIYIIDGKYLSMEWLYA